MTEIISGSCERGIIEFDGCMKTLGYTMKYHASGKITKRHIELDFDTDKGRFHANGEQDALSEFNLTRDRKNG